MRYDQKCSMQVKLAPGNVLKKFLLWLCRLVTGTFVRFVLLATCTCCVLYCESLKQSHISTSFGRPQRDRAQRVRDAQAKYCEEDPRAEMVISNDLGRYYHYDATSMLIIGNRIAHAYQKALDADVTCPVPTISPVPTVSTSPTAYPTTSTPTYSPTLVLAPIPSPPPFFCEHISTFFCFS